MIQSIALQGPAPFKRELWCVRGFSLIELMIVVAIIGIIAAVAYPSYQSHVEKARRSDAQGALTAFSAAMERHYTENGTYQGAAQGGNDTGAPAPTLFPSEAPLDGSVKYYDLRITAVARNTYTLTATPKGAQSGDGAMRLLSNGTKQWDRDGAGTWLSWDGH